MQKCLSVPINSMKCKGKYSNRNKVTPPISYWLKLRIISTNIWKENQSKRKTWLNAFKTVILCRMNAFGIVIFRRWKVGSNISFKDRTSLFCLTTNLCWKIFWQYCHELAIKNTERNQWYVVNSQIIIIWYACWAIPNICRLYS